MSKLAVVRHGLHTEIVARVDFSPTLISGLDIDQWVGPAGLEPATRGLKVRCSTN